MIAVTESLSVSRENIRGESVLVPPLGPVDEIVVKDSPRNRSSSLIGSQLGLE